MKKIILTILILSLFFLSSKTLTFAQCAPNCICSCDSGYHKGSQTCAGTETCSARSQVPACLSTYTCCTCAVACVHGAVTCDACPVYTCGPLSGATAACRDNCGPTVSKTCAYTYVPCSSGGGSACSTTCNGLGTYWHVQGSGSCPSGMVEGNCGSAFSGCTCCSCVAAPTPIPVCTTCPSLPTCSCPTVFGSDSPQCSITKNSVPTISDITIKSGISPFNTIIAETGNRNQICQTDFNGSRQVTFVINASDPDGDSLFYSLTWNGHSIVSNSTSNTITFNFPNDANWNNTSTYSLITTITDSYGGSASYNSRSFKIWDCNVPISGTGYDGSATGALCSDPNSFIAGNEVKVNYDLTMNDVGPGAGTDKPMTVTSPTYTYGSNHLVWGRDYIFELSNFEGGDPSIKINGVCSSVQFTITNALADAYSAAPSLTADFTSVLNQDPWWQTRSGGAISNFEVNNRVPVTCPPADANCKVSNGGLVSAPALDNAKISFDSVQPWFYGDIYNDGSPNISAKLANNNTSYSSFYSQYYVKNGVGSTLVSDNTTITKINNNPNNIYFINGNLTIDQNINIGSATNFLMIIVDGNIDVSSNVTNVDGILVANNISASSENDTSLTFNGSLYAINDINFSRGYITKLKNNTLPAVIVQYNPRLIFNLPAGVAKALTGWQWGN